MDQIHYGGAIWTNHALSRLDERGLSQAIASLAFNNPERTSSGRESGTKQYQRRFGKSLVTVVAKQNERSEWLIISCWVDPPISGSVDYKKRQAYHKFQKASFWGKIWITLKNQLGLGNF
ncbi:MAG TPA: hypothetical protein VM077_06260 [Candidatus Limnocylindrales bacterium]|nr:hypothetical protein [Candidatus Limnocylindrales bacterium]